MDERARIGRPLKFGAANTGGGGGGGGPRPKNVCLECNNEQPEKRKTALVFCASCNSCHHSGCLKLPVKTAKKIRTYDWRCNNCKICELCQQAGDEEKLVLCDACDRGYHTDCFSPPLPGLPTGALRRSFVIAGLALT